MSENNVYQLPQKAPFGPATALQAILICTDQFVKKGMISSNYTLRGATAKFIWGGRLYEMEVKDLGPSKGPA